MRFFVIAAVLCLGFRAGAQPGVEEVSGQKPEAVSRPPVSGQRSRRAAAPAAAAGGVKPEMVPRGATVATLHGVCREQAKGACETVITGEDLDRFVKTFGPDVPEAARARLAVQYARTVAFATLAELQGLDKNPVLARELDAQLKLARARILSGAFLQNLEARKTNIADSEIQKYYDAHRERYERVQVLRLSVPVSSPTENGRPLDRSVVKTEMAELRSRAVAGEDFNRLQQDAYKDLHIQAIPPAISPSALRRGAVQGDETKAFDLKPGEISDVLDLPAAFALVKLESREMVPLASVRGEIEATLTADYVQGEVSKLTGNVSAEFNLQLLGMTVQPEVFTPTAINPVPARRSVRRASSGARP